MALLCTPGQMARMWFGTSPVVTPLHPVMSFPPARGQAKLQSRSNQTVYLQWPNQQLHHNPSGSGNFGLMGPHWKKIHQWHWDQNCRVYWWKKIKIFPVPSPLHGNSAWKCGKHPRDSSKCEENGWNLLPLTDYCYNLIVCIDPFFSGNIINIKWIQLKDTRLSRNKNWFDFTVHMVQMQL